jgi:hypothetical protein
VRFTSWKVKSHAFKWYFRTKPCRNGILSSVECTPSLKRRKNWPTSPTNSSGETTAILTRLSGNDSASYGPCLSICLSTGHGTVIDPPGRRTQWGC